MKGLYFPSVYILGEVTEPQRRFLLNDTGRKRLYNDFHSYNAVKRAILFLYEWRDTKLVIVHIIPYFNFQFANFFAELLC